MTRLEEQIAAYCDSEFAASRPTDPSAVVESQLSTSTEAPRSPRRRSLVLTAAVAALLVGATAAVWVTTTSSPPTSDVATGESPATPAPGAVEVSMLWEGPTTTEATGSITVADSPARLKELYTRVAPEAPVPSIDFGHGLIVAVTTAGSMCPQTVTHLTATAAASGPVFTPAVEPATDGACGRRLTAYTHIFQLPWVAVGDSFGLTAPTGLPVMTSTTLAVNRNAGTELPDPWPLTTDPTVYPTQHEPLGRLATTVFGWPWATITTPAPTEPAGPTWVTATGPNDAPIEALVAPAGGGWALLQVGLESVILQPRDLANPTRYTRLSTPATTPRTDEVVAYTTADPTTVTTTVAATPTGQWVTIEGTPDTALVIAYEDNQATTAASYITPPSLPYDTATTTTSG